MATVTTLAASITALDTIPPSTQSPGEGGPGLLRSVNDYVVAVAGNSIGSQYRMVRIPTYARVKSVILDSGVTIAGAADIDVAHSDAYNDGTPVNLRGSIVQVASADNKLFGAAATLVSVSRADKMFSGSMTQGKAKQPLWQALGFTSDPGGNFDILLKLTEAIGTGGTIGVRVDYVI